MSHWLLEYHPDYRENFERWLFAKDHLEANVYPDEHGDLQVIDSFVPKNVQGAVGVHDALWLKRVDREYLIQKEQGEVDVAYNQRAKLTSYTPYFPYAVTSLVGMFFDAQENLTPTWQPEDADDGLGDPEDPDSIAYTLERDWDGAGNGFAVSLWHAAIDMVALGEVWPVVHGVQRDPDTNERISDAAVSTHLPLDAENWLEGADGQLEEAKIRMLADTRTSIRNVNEGSARAIRWLIYDTEGWERYTIEPGKSAVSATRDAEEAYVFYATTDRRRRILPVYRVGLPVRGNPGYNAARAANEIFNLESGLSFQLWYSSYAKFFANVVDEDGNVIEQWEEIKKAFLGGDSLIPGNGEYKAPPSENGDMKDRWIEKLVERFFRTFYQQFGDAARERTATEIRQESRSGVQAFLILLAYALERYVNQALWRIEQVYFPNRPDLWGQASWTARKDFDPVDIEEQVERMIETVMPRGRMPMLRSTIKEVIRRWHQAKDLPLPEEDDMDAVVDTLVSREQQAESAMTDFLGG